MRDLKDKDVIFVAYTDVVTKSYGRKHYYF